MVTLDDLRSDEHAVVRLMQMADPEDHEQYCEFIAAMAPYKSAVIWPEALLFAPEANGERYVFFVHWHNLSTHVEVVAFSQVTSGCGVITEADQAFRAVCANNEGLTLRSKADKVVFHCGWWSLLCDEHKLFFDVADALRYAAALEKNDR